MTTTRIKIRGYHLDGYGHVNNARYLELLEEARWDFLDKSNAITYFQKKGLLFVIVRIEIDYKFPAVMNDVLEIHTQFHEHGNSSVTFLQQAIIKEKGNMSCKALVKFVLLDAKTNKPAPITKDHLDFLKIST